MNPPEFANIARPLPPRVVLKARIVWAAMIVGQVFFAIVIAVIRSQQTPPPVNLPTGLLNAIAAAVLGGAAVLGLVLGALIIKRDADGPALGTQYLSAKVISMALLEAPSLFALVIVFLTGRWWPTALISAVAIALQLSKFPRASV